MVARSVYPGMRCSAGYTVALTDYHLEVRISLLVIVGAPKCISSNCPIDVLYCLHSGCCEPIPIFRNDPCSLMHNAEAETRWQYATLTVST